MPNWQDAVEWVHAGRRDVRIGRKLAQRVEARRGIAAYRPPHRLIVPERIDVGCARRPDCGKGCTAHRTGSPVAWLLVLASVVLRATAKAIAAIAHDGIQPRLRARLRRRARRMAAEPQTAPCRRETRCLDAQQKRRGLLRGVQFFCARRGRVNASPAPAASAGSPSRRRDSSPPSAPSRTPAPRSGARARATRRTRRRDLPA